MGENTKPEQGEREGKRLIWGTLVSANANRQMSQLKLLCVSVEREKRCLIFL